ncbi:MAG: hypothetical protein SPL94_00050 [Oribacterium sp.]|nr:hypothetical protein [Oribacterium sp.]
MRKVKTRKTSDFPGKSGSLVCNEYITPVIIKYPVWQYTDQNDNATYACINMREALAPRQIQDRSILIDGDIREAVADLLY